MRTLTLALFLFSCTPVTVKFDETGGADDSAVATDLDGDGYTADDCDDFDALIHPGAEELCNGVDEDCDGVLDNDATDAATWYIDYDHDGYGSPDYQEVACDAPEGYVDNADDCDDARDDVSPGLEEFCGDLVDNDCDTEIDEDVDFDLDGVTTCEGDCNDEDGAVNPNALEYCNEVDDDCDGEVDDDPVDITTWYVDSDEDGFGDSDRTAESCEAPIGYVSDATDCDDSNAEICPGGVEICNEVDDDCDGAIDDGAVISTWYADEDGDGYGNALLGTESCEAPSGYVLDDTDCDDGDALVYPSATELCDGLDNDCDGSAPSEEDDDLDGFRLCDSDCDDADATSYLGAVELCDGIDNDCDGAIDNDTTADGDGDGVTACDGDCDDADATISPSIAESCNGVDDDCDGTVDDGFGYAQFYRDYDSDGRGDDDEILYSCALPSGYSYYGGDCDDTDATVYPSATETCDGVDEDCDGTTDEGTDCYDDDGDGSTEADGDCDDADITVYPSASESCDGEDDDCDGTIDESTSCYDDDGDGWTETDGDCDDTEATISPSADEYCDLVDNNCDGEIDEDTAVDASTWYEDADLDGYGDPAGATIDACSAPSGYADNADDCDDTDDGVFPGQTEFCNGHDDDCDGIEDDGC